MFKKNLINYIIHSTETTNDLDQNDFYMEKKIITEIININRKQKLVLKLVF